MSKNSPLIAHIIFRFSVGGLENGLVNLINRLPRDKYRHAIICLTESTDFSQRLEVPVPVYCLHKREGKDIGLYWRLLRLLRQLRPDMVHTRNLATLEGQACAYAAGVKGRIHGEHGWDVADLTGNNPRYRKLRKFMRPLVGCYIPLSRHLERYLREEIKVSPAKIKTICNGVDTSKFHPRSDNFIHPHGWPSGFDTPESIVFGTVGRLEAVKDQLTLLQAFAILLRDHSNRWPPPRLVVVGDGSQMPLLANFVRENRLEQHVWLAGNRNDVPELMRSLDVFVLPSLAEGISNTILEAMASGLPVVATDVGGNPELVQPGVTGFLVPSRDPQAMARQMAAYMATPELIACHSKAARDTAETVFSIDRMVAQYAEVYDRVARERLGMRRMGRVADAMRSEATGPEPQNRHRQ